MLRIHPLHNQIIFLPTQFSTLLSQEVNEFLTEWHSFDDDLQELRNELWQDAMDKFLKTLTRLRTEEDLSYIYNPIGNELDRLMKGGVSTIIISKCMADHISLDVAFRTDHRGAEWELFSFCSTGCAAHSRHVVEVLDPFIRFITGHALKMQMEQMPSASSETGPEELTLIPSLVPVEPQPKGSMACGPSACYFAEVVLAYLLPESAEPEWLEWAALSTARELKAVGNIPAADYLERRNHYKTVLCDLSAQYIKVRYIPSKFTLIGSHPISRLALLSHTCPHPHSHTSTRCASASRSSSLLASWRASLANASGIISRASLE